MLQVVLILVLWGSWPILARVAGGNGFAAGAVFWSLAAATAAVGSGLWALGRSLVVPAPAVVPSVLAGLALGAGLFLFHQLLEQRATATVTAMTGLYPLVTAVLAWAWLGEPLTPQKLLGIALAGLAVFLLAR